ncbi:F-box/LRR-repeat protein 13 [Morus notabilis]|uniref:F-box/LRR-repeat protein 13 n=1 Tax=Morus notabilis TaxID=981085 RepID=W9RLC5_9ROSA|nr:F-box/LRR-repeat protein 13 [Morus notabilis]EXB80393.1 F-box/LRR-repeat protein 13 [Morus notabilis]
MAAKRVKRVKVLKERKKYDHLSELPDCIIHHILSFLPAIEVVQMSILSKRWRRMWYYVPALNFCQISVYGSDRFPKFVDEYLKYREIGLRSVADSSIITRFKLRIMCGVDFSTLVDKWLNFVVLKNKLEELDLYVKPWPRLVPKLYHCLPGAVLGAKSLTHLKLEYMRMVGPLQVSLPVLKLLSLKHVSGLNDHSFEHLLANCPSLEELVLRDCRDLSTPQISSSTLKSSELQLVSNQRIKIDAIKLQFLLFGSAQNCRISLATCASLKSLSLCNAEFLGRCLEDHISELTGLESLTICESIGSKHIKNIRSRHLKNLIISQTGVKEVGAIKIDAVNLVSFTYRADSMKTFCNISLNSPNLRVCNVKLTCQCRTYDSNWYISLIRLLSNLNCCKNVCLHVYSEEALVIPNDLRSVCRASLLAIEHLKVKTYRLLFQKSDLKDSLYWLSPSLKSLSMEQQSKGFRL